MGSLLVLQYPREKVCVLFHTLNCSSFPSYGLSFIIYRKIPRMRQIKVTCGGFIFSKLIYKTGLKMKALGLRYQTMSGTKTAMSSNESQLSLKAAQNGQVRALQILHLSHYDSVLKLRSRLLNTIEDVLMRFNPLSFTLITLLKNMTQVQQDWKISESNSTIFRRLLNYCRSS